MITLRLPSVDPDNLVMYKVDDGEWRPLVQGKSVGPVEIQLAWKPISRDDKSS